MRRAKARIFENQTELDAAVLNADDPHHGSLRPEETATLLVQPKTARATRSLVCAGEDIIIVHHGKEEFVMKREEIPLAGAHNVENVLAAVTAARSAGVATPTIAQSVRDFAGVEHRLEFVAEIAGVRYFNDSKATNVDATLKALDAFAGRILIILGGKDKGSDYTTLQKPLREKAILALLIGAAADKIEQQIAGSVAIERAFTLDRAVDFAAHAAQPGDIVVLVPPAQASTSFRITSIADASSRNSSTNCARIRREIFPVRSE